MWSLVVAATRHTNSADLVILIVLVLIGFQVWRRRSMGGGTNEDRLGAAADLSEDRVDRVDRTGLGAFKLSSEPWVC